MDRHTAVLFTAAGVLLGAPYLFIKVAVEDLTPSAIALARTALAALVLTAVVGTRAVLRVWRRHRRAVVLLAVVQFAVPFTLIAWGEQHLSSSLTGLLIATEPLLVAALAGTLNCVERPDQRQLLGMLVGLAGVGVLLGVDLDAGRQELIAAAAVVAATACYAAVALTLPRLAPDAEDRPLAAAALALAAVVLAPLGALEAPTAMPSPTSLAALVALAGLCTALAFPVWFALVARAGARRAALVTYVNPVVALALGAALLDEPVTPTALAGLALILTGTGLATLHPRPTAPAPPHAPKAPAVSSGPPAAARTSRRGSDR